MDLLAQPADLELLGGEGLAQDNAELLLRGATGAVRSYCGWVISSTTETFTLDGDGGGLLFLPSLHVRDVTAVRVAGEEQTGYAWSVNGTVEALGCWKRGRRNVEVDAVHGYEQVPGDVVDVVLAVALRGALNPAGTVSESFAGATSSWAHAGFGLTTVERATLDPYRIPGQP